VRVSGIFQDLATILKIVLIVVLLVAGFAGGGTGQVASFAPTWNDMRYMTSAPFAISLVFVMYSYWGWNAATYIASDVRDPQRSLPRSLLIATLLVLVLYTGLNAAFLYSTPMNKLSGQLNVAMIAGTYIFGEAGGRIVAALMCLGLVPAIGALVWIGPRIAAIMGEDVKLLRVFARRNGSGVPVVAMWYQAAVVTLLLVTGSFETVLEFIQFSLTLSSFLAVLGVIVLRYTQPDLPRPYRLRTLLAPGVYLGVTTFMLVHLVIERPFQSLAGLAMMAVGLIIWAVSAAQTGKEALQGSA
jgi:basic amino acid/polyamine antiporter, APA family